MGEERGGGWTQRSWFRRSHRSPVDLVPEGIRYHHGNGSSMQAAQTNNRPLGLLYPSHRTVFKRLYRRDPTDLLCYYDVDFAPIQFRRSFLESDLRSDRDRRSHPDGDLPNSHSLIWKHVPGSLSKPLYRRLHGGTHGWHRFRASQ